MSKSNLYQIGERAANFLTNVQKLQRGIWPWTKGLKARLPLHYKIRYTETWMKEMQPVHYIPDSRKFIPDPLYGSPVRVRNIPIHAFYPNEADHGLWAGEGIVAGLARMHRYTKEPDAPKIWKPFLTSRLLYSEILDKYFNVTVTLRTLELIDQNFGLDYYILNTHQIDLKSKFGMNLKRQMLMAIAEKKFPFNDVNKCEEIYEKYKRYEIPVEEAEWVGLTLQEAERKQHEIEEALEASNLKPLKDRFADELLDEIGRLGKGGEDVDDEGTGLKDAGEEVGLIGELKSLIGGERKSKESSWKEKLNPFK